MNMSIRVPYETVKSTVTQAFLNLGLSQEKAEKCAEIHTESSLEGIESHGRRAVWPRAAAGRRRGRRNRRRPPIAVRPAALPARPGTPQPAHLPAAGCAAASPWFAKVKGDA